mmetsp:Transcript_15133/g.45192  ORF Transcript_15133/g.45192 Transcript_15133/m.45192 type:complete len:229 (+) Transcript_15133:580-1266(+)
MASRRPRWFSSAWRAAASCLPALRDDRLSGSGTRSTEPRGGAALCKVSNVVSHAWVESGDTSRATCRSRRGHRRPSSRRAKRAMRRAFVLRTGLRTKTPSRTPGLSPPHHGCARRVLARAAATSATRFKKAVDALTGGGQSGGAETRCAATRSAKAEDALTCGGHAAGAATRCATDFGSCSDAPRMTTNIMAPVMPAAKRQSRRSKSGCFAMRLVTHFRWISGRRKKK